MAFVSFEVGGERPPVTYSYRGPITESVIAATSQSLRARLLEQQVEKQLARRIFSSFVELTYNILHHGVPEPSGEGRTLHHGELRLEERDNCFELTATSRMTREAASGLLEKIAQFAGMTRDQIRFEYQLRISNLQYEPADSQRVGAGLGLVTLARDARGPLRARFEDTEEADAPTCLFSICSTI